MAGASLLTLLDDITTVLDDVATMTKVAAKKTAGVLGDDLALNAQQVTGIHADRELPVVWAVAKGSFLNKLILVPSALLISAFFPKLVTILLMIGGLYLCFEGAEKLVHRFLHHDDTDTHHQTEETVILQDEQIRAFESEKIKGAIRTDFILSAEIVVIALGTMAATTFMNQVLVLSTIAIAMTVGVYGLVAGIVKLDDVGFWLMRKSSAVAQTIGRSLVSLAPKLMKFLSIAGTVAMFMVGGGILVHGIPALHHGVEDLSHLTGLFSGLTAATLNAGIGLLAGLITVAAWLLIGKIRGKASG